jgi:hypothetical protein
MPLTLATPKASSKLGILVEGHLRCIGSPAHLHKRFSRHVTVNVQCANVVALETALCALDAHMKLAEVVRRSRVYLLSKSVDQIALLQCLEKLHNDGTLQVMRRFASNACQLMQSLYSDSAWALLLCGRCTCG